MDNHTNVKHTNTKHEHVNSIAKRLSLRMPQRKSLEILAWLTEVIPLSKECDLIKDLKVIASKYPLVKDFERDFPSLCFALATGVGKTRLMGAFISYLHLAKDIKHFFVLAPNLTIYKKLIDDFTPGTKKYVFHGISQFSTTPPIIITGETYETGRGIRGVDMFGEGIHINIFNISKINAEMRGGKSLRIKRRSEYIGKSYFDYLAGLEDFVLLMDESHRYRASAGVKAINELKPILGLELTATPQVEQGRKSTREFQNIIYSYPLRKAMEDGYVKEPAVATRENFNVKNYTEEQLEQLKLEDGICIHERVKTDLKTYANNHNKPYVKPFMLVVAQDTTHAENIMERIKSDTFFEGRYKDRVITIHSSQRGEEKDETVDRLLAVEDPNEPTEIVIHVNMLKEGWDVTNLYTIVPLRAANSRTLVEQSIGRGLRLPYGKRTGISAVDRLTIVSHDRFDDIIREANDAKSIIRTGIIIGKDVDYQPKKTLDVSSNLESIIIGRPAISEAEKNVDPSMIQSDTPKRAEKTPLFREEEKEVASATLEVIKGFERLPSAKNLKEESIQQEIVKRVEAKMKPKQAQLEGIIAEPNIEEVVKKVTQACIENMIDIPRIIVTPKNPQHYTFERFTLDTSDIGCFNPVEQEILIQYLRTRESEKLQGEWIVFKEERDEDYIVSALIDFNAISYNDHTAILYDLAGQMVAYIRSYLNDKKDVLNVLQYYRKELAHIIYTQMKMHYKRGYTEYEVTIKRGFESPKMVIVSYDAQEMPRHFRDDVEEKRMIVGMLFQGFKKCIYPIQKFHSDTERKFAVLLEDETDVLKWSKPAREDFRIFYGFEERKYEPDFVVETETYKFLCETKMAKEMDTEEVWEKARSAEEWCERVRDHELKNGGKPWRYVLIPHDAIQPSATLEGLVSRFSKELAA